MANWDGVNEENQREYQRKLRRYEQVKRANPYSRIPKPTAPRHVAPWRPPARAQTYRPQATAPAPRVQSYSGGGQSYSGYDYAAAQAAAEAKRKAEQQAREARENAQTNAQVDALIKIINDGLAKRREGKLANIESIRAQQTKSINDDYQARLKPLDSMEDDNKKSEHDSTFSNLANRSRERGELLDAALAQGVGETDLIRALTVSARNWYANQSQTNRAFHDTQTSINKSRTDLGRDTRTALLNIETQANDNRRNAWSEYWSSVADTWTQIGNVQNANQNESYKARYADAFSRAADAVSQTYKDPGISAQLQAWTGPTIQEQSLNTSNTDLVDSSVGPQKRPEGSTLRRWR